ncbi:retrovirus-related pol polyprotein from transposon TNT 1-94 [Tanacetum coccineum]
MATNEETNAAGTDTRPPMLVESDYESWKIRIHSVPAPREKLDSEFSEEENKLEMADTQAEIILSQGLPRHIFNNLNQTSTAKEIWDNIVIAYAGSCRTIHQRIRLFDDTNAFAIGNRIIHDYFIYTHLKAYEPHAKKTLKKHEQSTSIVDPLAYVAHTTSAPVLSSPSTPSPQPTAQSPNDALMATMTQIANLLSGFQKRFHQQQPAQDLPPTQGLLLRCMMSHCYEPIHESSRVKDKFARQCKEAKRKMDSQYFKAKALLMELKEKGDIGCLDSETCMKAPMLMSLSWPNLSSTSATNRDCTRKTFRPDAETVIDDITIPYHQYLHDTEAQNGFQLRYLLTQQIKSMIAILTDLQTQLDGHAKVNQEKCLEVETLKNELSQCKQEIYRLDTQKVKLDLENKVRQEQALVIQRNKQNAELVQENDLLKSTLSGKEKSIAFLQSEKEKILSEKKDLADSYLDEIVCLKNANKVARDILQRFNMPTETIPMFFKKPKKATADLHKDLLGTRNPGLGYMAKRAQPALYDADTLLHLTHPPVSIWDSEEALVQQVVSMKKMSEKPGHVRPANGFYEKLNALMFVPQQELSSEQAYWHPANERASRLVTPNNKFIKERTTKKPDYVSEWCFDYAKQFVEQQLVPFYDYFKKHIDAANDTFFKEIREFEQIFDELEAEYEQCVLDNKNLTIEKKNLLIKNDCLIAECLEKDICSIVLTSDIVVPPSSNCLCEDLRSACDREHTKVLELEAEISKQKHLITESEKRFAFLEQNYVCLQLKFQNYKQCIDTSSASNAIFEINKLRQQLQGKDDTIRNLDAQINIMKVLNVGSTEGSCDQQALDTDRIQLKDTITSLRIQLDGLKVENVSLKRRYDELSQANTHSRTANTEKLSALTAENTKLKAQVTGKTSSGPSTSETPKVLAPGMYNLGSKYIPPPKRANWVKPTPLPKKKQVTFSEPPRPSLKPTQKPVVHPKKQTNAANARDSKQEAHHRTLNKKNRVDSNLLVKHSVSVSNLNNVCGACNKSLVFANHSDCLVMCDGSVNVKPHQTKRFKRQPRKEWKPVKKVWKPISKPVANSKPQWKPTGRHFSLFEKQVPKGSLVVQIVLWYLDSGCSRHMTGDRARLINFVEKFIGTVRFGNDEYAAIVGYGDYKLGDTIISRVYYVEGLKHNLFSVGQFCDGGLEVAFRQHSCHIRNYDMVDLLKGSRTTNLYSISLNDMMSASPVCLLTKASSTKSWLWHRRLNHLNFGTLNELARKNLVRGLPMLKYNKDHLCPSCQLGKSKKASHPLKTENTNTEVLHSLHMDLCGPMRTESINGKKYVLVIVDDYTRFGWVRFLRTKDETPQVIEKFIVKTQRALNATVRFVRTNKINGIGVMNNTPIRIELRVLGISHDTSYTRLHKQTAVCRKTEREHLCVSCTVLMLIFANAPLIHGPASLPQHMTSVTNSTELKLTALQSGSSRSALVKDPEPPSVPPTKKQVVDLFQWFDDDEVDTIHSVISEGVPAVTESLLPHQVPLPDTSDSDVETLFDHVDSNVFDTYNVPETDSEASSSNTVNIE